MATKKYIYCKKCRKETPCRGNAMWFPYWHLVKLKKGTKCKYGQWAPLMDDRLFSCLVRQAKKKGHKF